MGIKIRKRLQVYGLIFDHFRKSKEDNTTQHVETALIWHVVLWLHSFVRSALDQQVIQTDKGRGHTNFNDKLTTLVLVNVNLSQRKDHLHGAKDGYALTLKADQMVREIDDAGCPSIKID